ncbi:MAG: hypothetical protein ACREVS_18865, partial [Burkholderiales bacterium]
MNKPTEVPRRASLATPFDKGVERWEAEYAEGMGEDRPVINRSGIPVKPLYTPRDWDSARYDETLGFPGQPPYT